MSGEKSLLDGYQSLPVGKEESTGWGSRVFRLGKKSLQVGVAESSGWGRRVYRLG